MLAQRADEIPTLFPTSRILKQFIDNPLLCLTTTLPLGIRNLRKSLVHPLDGKRHRFPQSEALLLLRLESHVTRISVLVVDPFKRSGIQPADLL